MFRLIPQGSWITTNAENKFKAYRRLKMSSPGQGKGNKRKSKGRGGTGRGRGRQQLPSTTPGRSQDAAKLPDEKSADEGQLAGASCISSNSASFSDSKAQSEDKRGRESRSKTDSSFKASSTPTAPVKTKETTSPVEHRETLQKSSRPSPKTNEPGKSMQQPCSVKASKAGKSPSSSPSSSSSASGGKLITLSLDAILTSSQKCEKLQCLYENLMSNNFHKTAVLKKISIAN